jgi:hypothetical protein
MCGKAQLYLNGCLVGRVNVKRWLGAWGFGEFVPTAAFTAFREVYDQWASLMHSGEGAPLDRAIAAALSQVEYAMDRIHGQLVLEDGQRRNLVQLNIDGNLVEWEEQDAVMASDRRIAGSQERFEQNEPARGGLHFAN